MAYFTIKKQDGIAIVTLDQANSPVNVLSATIACRIQKQKVSHIMMRQMPLQFANVWLFAQAIQLH